MQCEWRLRTVMADRGMWHTTDLLRALENAGHTHRGVSVTQIYRLVTGTPERLSLPTLAALCDVLQCSPNDLLDVG